jgi:hypothetical protein
MENLGLEKELLDNYQGFGLQHEVDLLRKTLDSKLSKIKEFHGVRLDIRAVWSWNPDSKNYDLRIDFGGSVNIE